MTTPPSFMIGYHPFHRDVSINYQLNRFCDGSPTSVAELIRFVESDVELVDYQDYH